MSKSTNLYRIASVGLLVGTMLALPRFSLAQPVPSGHFMWISEDKGPIEVTSYRFAGDGELKIMLLNHRLEFTAKWRRVGDTVEILAVDGTTQTYAWTGKDLYLVASTGPMPRERVLLRRVGD